MEVLEEPSPELLHRTMDQVRLYFFLEEIRIHSKFLEAAMKAKDYIKPALKKLKDKLLGKPEMKPKSQQYDHEFKKPRKHRQIQFRDPNLLYERKKRQLVQVIDNATRSQLHGLLHR